MANEACKVVTVWGAKGGKGSSTLVIALSQFAAQSGKYSSVLVIDSDKNESVSRWSARRETSEKAQGVVTVLCKSGDLVATIRTLKQRLEGGIIFCDAGGHDSRSARSAMLVSSLVLVATKNSQMDVDVNLGITAPIIEECRTLNPDLAVLMVQNACSTTSQSERLELAKAFKDMQTVFKLADTYICDRKAYRTSVAAGLGPYESGDVKVRAEVESLFNEIMKEI